MAAVKGTFAFMGQSYKAFWNGKRYGATVYVTVTGERGSEVKVSWTEGRLPQAGGSHSTDFAEAALVSVGLR